jgi:hypothetical protein
MKVIDYKCLNCETLLATYVEGEPLYAHVPKVGKINGDETFVGCPNSCHEYGDSNIIVNMKTPEAPRYEVGMSAGNWQRFKSRHTPDAAGKYIPNDR